MNATGRRTTRGIRGIGLCLAVAAASIGPAPARGQAPAAEPAATAEQRDLPRNLRVAVAPIASAVEWQGDRPVGVMIDVWNDLAGRLGTTTEFVRVEKFTDLMRALLQGTADVSLGPLAITEERERTLDLTHPVFHSGLRIAVRQRNDSGFLSAMRSLLSWKLLTLIGMVLALAVVSGHLLWWFERGRNPHSFPPDYLRGVGEAMWWILSTIVTGGCDDKHVDGPLGRMLAFAWMAGGIGLIAAFTSVLTATMTAEQVSGLIHSPRDLAGRTVGCQADSVAVPAVRQRGGIPQEYATIREALDALELGMVEAVVGENQSLMDLVNRIGRGDIVLVGPIFESFDFGLALPNGSPFRERLNTAILRMREDGTLQRLMENWLGRHE
jgi:polar amino acid transport system substrate-binding protein